jgi:hypothetical protein
MKFEVLSCLPLAGLQSRIPPWAEKSQKSVKQKAKSEKLLKYSHYATFCEMGTRQNWEPNSAVLTVKVCVFCVLLPLIWQKLVK